MILQALVAYYDRKVEFELNSLAPEGWVPQAIPFLVVIDGAGRFLHFEDTREAVGRRAIARTFTVPAGPKRSSGIASNLLWDKLDYALGIGPPDRAERTALCNQAFRQKIVDTFGSHPNDAGVAAVLAFLDRLTDQTFAVDPLWVEIQSSSAVVSFLLAGDPSPVFARPAVLRALERSASAAGDNAGLCSVSGQRLPIARLHPAIKGVVGAQSSGASLVSFNVDAAESFGREQGENAPVSESAASKYGKALNSLLSRDSRQVVRFGSDSSTTMVVFWAEKATGTEFERAFKEWFDPQKDNPDSGTQGLHSVLSWRDDRPLTADDAQLFYVLGLSPNAARLSVRFFQVATIRDVGRRMFAFYSSLDTERPEWEPWPLPPWRVLQSLSAQQEAKNLAPNLCGEWIRAILAGLPFPAALLAAAVRRNRADQEVPFPRAALIKGHLLSHNPQEPLTVALNRDNPFSSYQLGRLFAVLERIQEEASPGLNATIRDRYYGAASATPGSVFPILMRTKNHHLSKIASDRAGRSHNLDKLVGEIVDRLDGGAPFPQTLPLADQGRFAVGYYQQKQHASTYKAED